MEDQDGKLAEKGETRYPDGPSLCEEALDKTLRPEPQTVNGW